MDNDGFDPAPIDFDEIGDYFEAKQIESIFAVFEAARKEEEDRRIKKIKNHWRDRLAGSLCRVGGWMFQLSEKVGLTADETRE